ncbi:MAG: hypothetical protein K8J08_10855, partial [Thermoanaerobaculia bacterium]|nr:hypothetical protein [Thermoanaerobaculia bacterium]
METPYYWLAPAFATLTHQALFTGFDGVHGLELWRTDGTESGTVMVRDICPGVCSGIREQQLVVFGNRVYFEASDGVFGEELWVSDGSWAGTHRVADIHPGFESSHPSWITPVGERLYFTVRTPGAGTELWLTDGTAEGTQAVVDPKPGADLSDLGLLTAVGDQLFFFADDGSHGIELWHSDGTSLGSGMVTDLNPGPASAISQVLYPASISLPAFSPVASGNELLFRANDGTVGLELFATEASALTTRLVADLEPGPLGSNPERLTTVGDEVFFSAQTTLTGRELWRSSDGEAELVIDLYPGPDSSFPAVLGVHDEHLLFFADEPSTGSELRSLNLATQDVDLVTELVAGSEGAVVFAFYPAIATANGLFFPANDQVHGMEWWFTDGTPEGTRLTRDVSPGALHSTGYYRTLGTALPGGGALLSNIDPVFGMEPWRSDGSEAGTVLLADLNQQKSAFPPTVSWFLWVELQAGGGEALFLPSNPSKPGHPWRSDGTEPGTVPLTEAVLESHGLDGLTWTGETWFFRGTPWSGGSTPPPALWVHDEEPQSPRPVETIAGVGLLYPNFLTNSSGSLMLNSSESLWSTDGSPEGTVALGEEAVSADQFEEHVYLIRGDRLERLTSGGVVDVLVDLTPLGVQGARGLVVANSTRMFFVVPDSESGFEPWTTDGTPEGTLPLGDLRPGGVGSFVFRTGRPYGPVHLFVDDGGFVPVGNQVFFSADDGVHGEELWVSDGSPGGTQSLGDLFPGPTPSTPLWLTQVGGGLFFVATTPAYGRELWFSNGTPRGTKLALDLFPGPESAAPSELTLTSDLLFFAANHPDLGVELFTLDDMGHLNSQDINRGASSSSPTRITADERI